MNYIKVQHINTTPIEPKAPHNCINMLAWIQTHQNTLPYVKSTSGKTLSDELNVGRHERFASFVGCRKEFEIFLICNVSVGVFRKSNVLWDQNYI